MPKRLAISREENYLCVSYFIILVIRGIVIEADIKKADMYANTTHIYWQGKVAILLTHFFID